NYGFAELTPEPGGAGELRSTLFSGARGACVEDWVPANGMFYTAQNNCRCVPGAVYGVVAIGPNGAWPGPADFEKPRPVEKGPAFGALETAPARDDDWPTWRHDVERTGASAATLPDKLDEVWKTEVVKPATGPLAEAWDAQLTSCVTAPVVASGRVFVAGTDTGQVVALDAATGRRLWTATLGGRIDTPPTVDRGLCLVGCHDGWVYALRAGDGELAWRMRPAPWERRMVAFGQVESVWPAAGSVLVHDGVAYATAGRSSESDGGIALVAFDPVTGTQHWCRSIGAGVLRLNDVLFVRDGAPAWRTLRFDAKTGSVTAPAPLPDAKTYGGGKGTLEGARMDGTWTRIRNRQAGNAFTVGKVTADLLVWNDKVVVSPLAVTSRDGETPLWRPSTGRSRPVTAMALTENVVLFAGRDRTAGGFLWTFDVAKGTKTGEFALPAQPTHDGLAVAGGRVYVSLQDGSVVCLGKAGSPENGDVK
ncbi:MAG TPA: PQQ-binding-like beta-propeller repeat protein, partial [Planctomycetota bacterium]|nr:PQQ-binding-like beta-propeller repeat protein [Planctomycetota bacterium]